jgi:hypothetical protein
MLTPPEMEYGAKVYNDFIKLITNDDQKKLEVDPDQVLLKRKINDNKAISDEQFMRAHIFTTRDHSLKVYRFMKPVLVNHSFNL